MNPSGSLPFITVDGESLFESAAILRYLAVEYPSLNQFYPAGNILRAKIDAALDWNGTAYRFASIRGFAPIFSARFFQGKEPTEAVFATCQENRNKVSGHMPTWKPTSKTVDSNSFVETKFLSQISKSSARLLTCYIREPQNFWMSTL